MNRLTTESIYLKYSRTIKKVHNIMSEKIKKILAVVTSHDKLGDTGKPTGFYAEELAVPYWVFIDAGYEVDIMSIRGGIAPIDPKSVGPEGIMSDSVDRFMTNKDAMDKISMTFPINVARPEEYAAIFLAGGHGVMWDYPDNEDLAKIVSDMYNSNKVVGAVCHGPAGLLGATTPDGTPIIRGKKVNCFLDAEEIGIGLDKAMPFLLQTKLTQMGAIFEAGKPFEGHCVRDGNLVTGQNPRASNMVAEKILEILNEQAEA